MKNFFVSKILYDLENISEYQVLSRRIWKKILAIIGIPLFTIFGLQDLYHSNYLEFGFSLVSVIILCVLLVDLVRAADVQKSSLPQEILIRFFLAVFLVNYLCVIGVEESLSQILWVLIFPVLIFFSIPKKEALIWILCVAGILSPLLLNTNLETSPNEIFALKIRLFIVFGILSAAAFVITSVIQAAIENLVDSKKKIYGTTEKLETRIQERNQAEKINNVLIDISNAVNTARDLTDLYQSIHQSLAQIIDVTNFFIAIVDTKERTLYFPYHADTTDDDFFPITDFDPKNSLTGLVVSKRRPLLLRKQEIEDRAAQKGVWGPIPRIWMGAPLLIKDAVIGVIAAQSYIDDSLYNNKDLQVFAAVSDQVAIAIDRKQSEDALRESEKKYRHLFNSAPAGMYEIDFETERFLTVNDVMCRLSGYSEKEFLSLRPLDLLSHDSKKNIITRFKNKFSHNTLSSQEEYEILKKDGQKIPVILNHDVAFEKGRLSSARVVAHDITELKKTEEEKLTAQQIAGENKKLALVGQVAGKMAHDFNNILGIIMGNAELSLLTCKDETTRKNLEMIFEQTIRGKNLTKNLIAFAKSQEPKQEFFKISDKIDLVISLMKKDLEGIELITENKPGVPDLLADPGMIEHALVNLLQNSIHAVSKVKKPKITLRSFPVDDTICFEIEDNGCGIPKKHQDSIYDPSFTLKGNRDIDQTYAAGIKGTGYGMSNVKKYIEQHKGTIQIESNTDSGTKFTIHLPVVRKGLTKIEKEQIQSDAAQFGKHILLVEDEPAISDVQYSVLTQDPCNHKVDIAPNGQTALTLFEENTYDAVSLDYMLPGMMNGMQVYHRIRETDKTIPILFISGNIEFLESIRELKQKDSHIDHLSKPCQNKDYVHSINALLKKTGSV